MFVFLTPPTLVLKKFVPGPRCPCLLSVAREVARSLEWSLHQEDLWQLLRDLNKKVSKK